MIYERLTPAEVETVEVLALTGFESKHIAALKEVTIHTIKNNLKMAMQKTGTFGRVELAMKWNDPEFQRWLLAKGIL